MPSELPEVDEDSSSEVDDGNGTVRTTGTSRRPRIKLVDGKSGVQKNGVPTLTRPGSTSTADYR